MDALARSSSMFARDGWDAVLPDGARSTFAERPKRLGRRLELLRRQATTPLEEVRRFDARAFVDLPKPTVLELVVPTYCGPVWVRSDSVDAAATTDPVIDGPVWLALVAAVEADRVRPVDFRKWVEFLAGSAGTRPSRREALAEVEAWVDGVELEVQGWTVGRVLERIEARLFSVRVEDR